MDRMEGLRDRTKALALRIIRLYGSLPRETVSQVLGKQIVRSGTSVAANFREASRARSDAEFAAKFGVVEQELDEIMLWLELLVDSSIVEGHRHEDLHSETEELLKIIVTSIKKTRASR